MQERKVSKLIHAVATSDGAGVRLRRSLGHGGIRVDPFLMLDEFGTDRPEDYIAGFPSHPHRGFQTVTYMLDGHMRHEDHLGNVGELTQGGVQWMTAGRGVIHSEMPQQKSGRMRGFQLWLNLPAAEKMQQASYRDIPAEQIPVVALDGATARVIAGTLDGAEGAVQGPIHGLTTQPIFYDLHFAGAASTTLNVPSTHNAFVYVYEGDVQIGDENIAAHSAAVLGPGDRVVIAVGAPARAILLAGKPLNEPVVQQGPFVMNTHEEIQQAIADYRNGTLTA